MLVKQVAPDTAAAKAIGGRRGLTLVRSIHRAITVRYIVSLLAVAILACSTWRITSLELTAHEDEDQTIAEAGAQRMLSHQMAGLLAERLATTDADQRTRADRDLRETKEKFEHVYTKLTRPEPKGKAEAEATADLRHAYYDGPESVAAAFARMENGVGAIEDGLVDRQKAMDFIAWMRGPLIRVLDAAVKAHRDAAMRSLEELKHQQRIDLLLLLMVLVLEAAVVFEPLARRVRNQTGAILEQARQLADLSAEMKELAVTDGLTGLRNRRAFDLEVQRLSAGQSLIMSDSRAQNDNAAANGNTLGISPGIGIVLFDLDWFKQVNDQYGHDAGDAVLKAVGERLRHVCRTEDFAARLGGDEFVVILADVSSCAYVAAIGERLRKIISEPVGYKERTLRVGASVGCCVVPNDAVSIQQALGLADDLLRADKLRAKLRYTAARGALGRSLARYPLEPDAEAPHIEHSRKEGEDVLF